MSACESQHPDEMQPLTTAPERAPQSQYFMPGPLCVALDPIDKGRLCLPAFLLGESVANLRHSRTAESMREMSQLTGGAIG